MKAKDKDEIVEDMQKLDWSQFIRNEVKYYKLMQDMGKRKAKKKQIKNDNVNHPSHYTANGIECIEAIRASMTADQFCGYLKGNIIKYLWRYELKGKMIEDLQKASFYLTRLLKERADNGSKN